MRTRPAAITGCIREALSAGGFPAPDPERLIACVGPPLAVGFSQLIGAPVDSAEVAGCVREYRSRYGAVFLERTRLFPGVEEALVALAADHVLAVATSKPARFTEPLLEELAIDHFFGFVASPAPNALDESKAVTVGRALAALDHPSSVMVGDRSFDVVGARAHGLPTVGVTWGSGTREVLEACQAVAVIDRPSELAATVRGVFSEARNNASDGHS